MASRRKYQDAAAHLRDLQRAGALHDIFLRLLEAARPDDRVRQVRPGVGGVDAVLSQLLLAHDLTIDVGELISNESGRVTAVELITTSRGTFAATHAFAALTTPRLSTSWGLPPFLLPDAA